MILDGENVFRNFYLINLCLNCTERGSARDKSTSLLFTTGYTRTIDSPSFLENGPILAIATH